MTDPKAKPFLDLLAPLQDHPMWEHMHCSVFQDEVLFFGVYGGCSLEIDFDIDDAPDLVYLCWNTPPYPQRQGEISGGLEHEYTRDNETVLEIARKQLDNMLDIKNAAK